VFKHAPTLSAVLVLLGASFLAISAPVPAGPAAPDLIAVADKYLAAERNRQVEGATPTAVDAALAFLTDTVVFEHPRAGARIEGKETLRRGMLGFLGATRNPHDEILAKVVGPSVVALELRQSFETPGSAGWQSHTRRGVKVLEFDGLKIRRVIEFW
jgi:hypothetical protein